MGRGGLALSADWGILGGTFDPVHYAHLVIADQARDRLGLAGVMFVPARVPPHKQGLPISDAGHRWRMLQLAIAEDEGFRLTDLELRRTGPSYTVDTAAALREELGGDPWFVLSAEALRGMPAWHEPRRLLELVRLAVVPRPGFAAPDGAWLAELFPGQQERVTFLDGPMLGQSASEIRRFVAAGRSIRYLVPPTVERYIRDHGLYAPAATPDPSAAIDMERDA